MLTVLLIIVGIIEICGLYLAYKLGQREDTKEAYQDGYKDAQSRAIESADYWEKEMQELVQTSFQLGLNINPKNTPE